MGKWSQAIANDGLDAGRAATSQPGADPSEQRVKWSDVITNDVGPQDAWVGDKPLGSVMTKLSKQGKSAGFLTNLVAGIADDPQTQIKVYAASRFPNLPEQERLKRYGVHNGEVVYMGDDGGLYRETADTWYERTKRFAAQTGSNLPAIIMGIIGSTAGPGTAALGVAGGEGIRKTIAGSVLKEPQTTLGNIVDMGQEGALAYGGDVGGRLVTKGVNYIGAKRGGELAKEAGRGRQQINIAETKRIEGLGDKFGIDLYPPQTTGSKRLADKFNLLGDLESSAPIIQKAREKQVEQIDSAVYKFFNDLMGKPATATEIGEGLVGASKKAIQEPVKVRQAKASPLYKKAFSTDEVIDTKTLSGELTRNQNKIKALEAVEAEPDVETMVKVLDEKGIPTLEMLKEGKKSYIERITKDYKRVTKKDAPMKGAIKDQKAIDDLKQRNDAIEKALSGKPPEGFNAPMKKIEIDTSQAVKEIDDLMSVTVSQDPSYKALSQIKGMIDEAAGNLQKLDRVKRAGIDNVLNRTGTTPTLSREMGIVKEKLIQAMDDASPDYAAARKIFSEYSEEVTKQGKKTILGDISKLEGDRVIGAAKKLFSSDEVRRAPEIVTKVKTAIKKQNPEVWDKAVSSHLQGLFESTKQSATGGITNIGGQFYKKVWGDISQRKVLQAAMDPAQFQTLNDFMTVLSKSGMILGKESATATRQAMLEEIGGRGTRGVIRAATRPLVTKEYILGDRLLESLLYKNAKKLAEAMTSERAARQLERMRQLPATAENLIPMVTNFMGLVIAGEYSREGDRESMKDVLPPRLKGQEQRQPGRLKVQ